RHTISKRDWSSDVCSSDLSNDNAIGVIAQEFEEQYPELVKENSDGLKTVNYRAMSTVLWKITQEKDQELQETKAKVEDLESRLARLEALLSKESRAGERKG